MWDLKKGTNSHGWLASWLEHGANFKKVQTEIELQMLKKKTYGYQEVREGGIN